MKATWILILIFYRVSSCRLNQTTKLFSRILLECAAGSGIKSFRVSTVRFAHQIMIFAVTPYTILCLSKLQLTQSREIWPWNWRQKMPQKRLKQKRILRFFKYQNNSSLKNIPQMLLKNLVAFSASSLFLLWTIIWIQIISIHTLDSTELRILSARIKWHILHISPQYFSYLDKSFDALNDT
jgi:hypothetical protein